MVVPSGVPPVPPLCMRKDIGVKTVGDHWLVGAKLTVLTMLLVDFNTSVKVDSSVANFALDSFAVGDMRDSCKR